MYHRVLVRIACLLLGAATAAETRFSPFHDPNYVPGHDAIVHLFEWKWNDIANECERFLGPKGFGGVQTSPITENVIVASRPWWERYQPISYRWNTRSGNAAEFREMVGRCNRAGVRIYVDTLPNHMSADHVKVLGTGGSTADTKARLYPAVPYGPNDFHPFCTFKNASNPTEARNCELENLHDLDQGKEHVRGKIVDLMNGLITAGVAGFRIDAAKHIWPEDLKVIYSRLRTLNTDHGFSNNSRPFIYQEVSQIINDPISRYEYSPMGPVTEFRYGREISFALKGKYPLKLFKSIEESWDLLPSEDSLVFIDNHDVQRFDDVLNYKSPKLYKMAIAFMLAHPYGHSRVMSSFAFENFDQGPPADKNETILSPKINDDGSCDDAWICEHRWRQIYNMVGFRNAVNGTNMTDWWDNGNNQIAFSRGDRGFIAINADKTNLTTTIQTKHASGIYCDVISGNIVNGTCTGKIVNVDKSGRAYVEILLNQEDGVLAIHRNAKLPERPIWINRSKMVQHPMDKSSN